MTTAAATGLRDHVTARGHLVGDGGMGTLLQERGLDAAAPGELWNVERPEEVREPHQAYAEAGRAFLTTNTFGGTRPRLEMHGLGDRVHELNAAGAAIARERGRRARRPRGRRHRPDR